MKKSISLLIGLPPQLDEIRLSGAAFRLYTYLQISANSKGQYSLNPGQTWATLINAAEPIADRAIAELTARNMIAVRNRTASITTPNAWKVA